MHLLKEKKSLIMNVKNTLKVNGVNNNPTLDTYPSVLSLEIK